jgi:polyphosphate kinase
VPGWTDNIRVRSIIGRFLEHSRILYFANGSEEVLDGEFYIGSADWMYRNLSRRVEAATPIKDRTLRERLWEILQVALDDERQAWVMQASGSYEQLAPSEGAVGVAQLGSHVYTMEAALRRFGAVC